MPWACPAETFLRGGAGMALWRGEKGLTGSDPFHVRLPDGSEMSGRQAYEQGIVKHSESVMPDPAQKFLDMQIKGHD